MVECNSGYHHICLSFHDTQLALYIDGKVSFSRPVPAYTLIEGKSDGVELVASWEVPWEDNGANDLCVYRFGLDAEQVEYLSNVSLASLVDLPPGTNHTGTFICALKFEEVSLCDNFCLHVVPVAHFGYFAYSALLFFSSY